jgi:hypothetical protein
MTRKTIADLLNPSEYLSRLRHEAELQIKNARLDLDAQVAQARLEQNERHHSDSLAIERRKLEAGEFETAGKLELGREELDFRRQSAELAAHTSLEVARAQNAGALDLLREEIHGRIVEKTGNAVNESLLSALRRGEDSNRAFSGAMADIIKARALAKLQAEQDDRAERHRQNEREHELLRNQAISELEELKSRLRNEEFTHAQQTSRIEIPLLLRQLGLFEGANRPTEDETQAYIDALRTRGTI